MTLIFAMSPTLSLHSLTEGYLTNQKVVDECFVNNDDAKASWKKLLFNIEKLGVQELKVRQQELLQMLEENGVTYNVYGESNGLNRPWLLDAVPLVAESSTSMIRCLMNLAALEVTR